MSQRPGRAYWPREQADSCGQLLPRDHLVFLVNTKMSPGSAALSQEDISAGTEFLCLNETLMFELVQAPLAGRRPQNVGQFVERRDDVSGTCGFQRCASRVTVINCDGNIARGNR